MVRNFANDSHTLPAMDNFQKDNGYPMNEANNNFPKKQSFNYCKCVLQNKDRYLLTTKKNLDMITIITQQNKNLF